MDSAHLRQGYGGHERKPSKPSKASKPGSRTFLFGGSLDGMKTRMIVKGNVSRENGRKSKGPRTAAGKSISRLNAITHGILAREVVLPDVIEGEGVGEFNALHRQFWEHLAPEGPLEEMLVDRIVTAYWRMHRVLIAERGEVAGSVEAAQEAGRKMDSYKLYSAVMDGQLESSATGLFYVTHILKDVRESVKHEGELTPAILERVRNAFGGRSVVIATGLRKAYDDAVKNAEMPTATEGVAESSAPGSAADGSARDASANAAVTEGSPGVEAGPASADVESKAALALRELRLKHVLGYLDKELARLERMQPEAEEREKRVARARQDASRLPAEAALDKILRYEGSLERQIYRAMSQLERLQRLRRGDNVPPPMTLEVSRR